VALDGLNWPNAPLPALVETDAWTEIVGRFETEADAGHLKTVSNPGPWSHVRLRIYPDGGVSRLRVFGVPAEDEAIDPRVVALNAADATAATASLMRCCGSRRWASLMVQARPFASWTAVHGMAKWFWWQLSDEDWVEAFGHHPRIGADPTALAEKFRSTAEWSGDEQAGMAAASDDIIAELVSENTAYEDRFGYIFIVCATGLSAQEMLARLQARMPHGVENEIRIAAAEQVKITAIRLDKMEST
jgi:allantoicase